MADQQKILDRIEKIFRSGTWMYEFDKTGGIFSLMYEGRLVGKFAYVDFFGRNSRYVFSGSRNFTGREAFGSNERTELTREIIVLFLKIFDIELSAVAF